MLIKSRDAHKNRVVQVHVENRYFKVLGVSYKESFLCETILIFVLHTSPLHTYINITLYKGDITPMDWTLFSVKLC